MSVDKNTGFNIGITDIHYRVHDGGMYRVNPIYTGTADSAASEMLIVAGSTTECHLIISGLGDGNLQGELLKDVTVTANGSSLAAFNFYDSKTDSTTTKFFKTPTAATGTVWIQQYIPGGTKNFVVGANARTDIELILENNKYLLRLHNLAGAPSTMGITAEFYEIEEG